MLAKTNMDYSKNRDVLTKVIDEGKIIRPIAIHRKEDGTFELKINLR